MYQPGKGTEGPVILGAEAVFSHSQLFAAEQPINVTKGPSKTLCSLLHPWDGLKLLGFINTIKTTGNRINGHKCTFAVIE